jgi:hypothetical protein
VEIKINLEIGLSPALEGFLAKVLGGAQPAPAEQRQTPKVVAPVEEVAERAEAALEAAEEAPKRTRRTKAQMEAGAAAAAADRPLQSETSGDQTQPEADASSVTLADALEEAEAEEGATKDQLRAVVTATMARVPGCAPKLQAAWVAEFGPEQKSSGSILPENYGRAIEIANSLT